MPGAACTLVAFALSLQKVSAIDRQVSMTRTYPIMWSCTPSGNLKGSNAREPVALIPEEVSAGSLSSMLCDACTLVPRGLALSLQKVSLVDRQVSMTRTYPVMWSATPVAFFKGSTACR
jgi:hypothetical protein